MLELIPVVKHALMITFFVFVMMALIGSFLALVIAGILGPPDWNWKRVTFSGLSGFVLYIALVVGGMLFAAGLWVMNRFNQDFMKT